MNPLISQFLTAILRWALQGAFAYLVAKGILTEQQGTEMLVGIIGALLTLAWVLWTKHRDRVKFVTGLASPKGTTERQVEQRVKDGNSPPATLKKDEVAR